MTTLDCLATLARWGIHRDKQLIRALERRLPEAIAEEQEP